MIKNWIVKRLAEHSTVDGVVIIAAGIAMLIAPINLIAYGAIAYGAYTIWRAE